MRLHNGVPTVPLISCACAVDFQKCPNRPLRVKKFTKMYQKVYKLVRLCSGFSKVPKPCITGQKVGFSSFVFYCACAADWILRSQTPSVLSQWEQPRGKTEEKLKIFQISPPHKSLPSVLFRALRGKDDGGTADQTLTRSTAKGSADPKPKTQNPKP